MRESRGPRTLVVSVLPVPDGGTAAVTALGMRAWGLAQGLLAHGHDVGIVALADEARPPTTTHGVVVTTVQHHPDWPAVLAEADAVVMLYCSDAAHEITESARADLLVVLDVYVPWIVETAARQSPDLVRDYGPFLDEVRRWNEVLMRGDVFLCASQVQRHYYVGVLSALGGVNPFTYGRLRMLEVPFGLDEKAPPQAVELANPYRDLGLPQDSFILLWFGAIYPWFDIDPVLLAVQVLAAEDPNVHFVVVGGRNPWVPDELYGRGYHYARRVLAPLQDGQVHFVAWVPFEERLQWYAHADVVVSLNTPGLENDYSWRTRMADYVGAQRPVVTNGGDPLSERVLAAGGGFRTDGTAEDLADVIRTLRNKPVLTKEAVVALADLRAEWSWASTTRDLAHELTTLGTPWAEEDSFVREHHGPRRWARPRGVEAALLTAAHVLRRLKEERAAGTVAVMRDRSLPRLRRLAHARPSRFAELLSSRASR